jgi:hypothetical protein
LRTLRDQTGRYNGRAHRSAAQPAEGLLRAPSAERYAELVGGQKESSLVPPSCTPIAASNRVRQPILTQVPHLLDSIPASVEAMSTIRVPEPMSFARISPEAPEKPLVRSQ